MNRPMIWEGLSAAMWSPRCRRLGLRQWAMAVVTVLLCLSSASASLAQAQTMPRAEYPDVPTGHWAYEAINMLSHMGVIEGLPCGKYGGDKMMTRYEFSVGVARINRHDWRVRTPAELETMRLEYAKRVLNVDKRGANQPEYPDVPSGHWAAEAVKILSMAGILEGLPNGAFGATKPFTRNDGAVALARWLAFQRRTFRTGSEKTEKMVTTSYPDMLDTHWTFHAVDTLNRAGVFEGFADGKFYGTKTMSRYEFAVAFARVYKLL